MSDPVITTSGDKIIITVDTADAKSAPLSGSAKSRTIGSTRGNLNLVVKGRTFQIGCNVFVPAKGDMAPTDEERANHPALS